jgi:hypothetical protein
MSMTLASLPSMASTFWNIDNALSRVTTSSKSEISKSKLPINDSTMSASKKNVVSQEEIVESLRINKAPIYFRRLPIPLIPARTSYYFRYFWRLEPKCQK